MLMKNSFYALVLASFIVGGCASPDSPQQSVESIPKRAINKGHETDTTSNINQINQGLMMLKQENETPPATLDEAKRALKYPDSMWFDDATQKPLVYDAATGSVHREGAAVGSAPSQRAPMVPDISGVPGVN